MEGQSEDCPFQLRAPPLSRLRQRRNGGAVGRLPVSTQELRWRITPEGPQWRGSRKTARFPGGIPGGVPHPNPPQWRGSRKTARFDDADAGGVGVANAAMEGQSEDCPFLTTPA